MRQSVSPARNRGRAHFLEIKTEIGALSDAQQSVCAALMCAQGCVGVVRDAHEVLEHLDAWRIPRARRIQERIV